MLAFDRNGKLLTSVTMEKLYGADLSTMRPQGGYSEGYLTLNTRSSRGSLDIPYTTVLDTAGDLVWSGEKFIPHGQLNDGEALYNAGVHSGLLVVHDDGYDAAVRVETGEFLISPENRLVIRDDFRDGLATAYDGSVSGVVDTEGNYVILLNEFGPGSRIGPFNEGLAIAEIGGQYYLLEKHKGTWSGQLEPEPEPAQTFTDVTPDKWYYDFVETVAEKGLFAGNGDGTFAPENNMTYAEFLAVLFQFSGDTLPANSGPNWYDNHVQWAKNSGVIPSAMLAGFDPEAAITRQDMAALFGTFLSLYDYSAEPVNSGSPSFSDEGSIADYAKGGVALCYQLGIMNGNDDGTFAPGSNAIRAEVAVTMVQMARVMGR